MASSSAFQVGPELETSWKQLKFRRKHRWMSFKLKQEDGKNEIVVDQIGPRKDDADTFFEALDGGGCRYAVYEHEEKKADGRLTSKLYFVRYFPSGKDSLALRQQYLSEVSTLKETLGGGLVDVSGRDIEELRESMGFEEDEEDSD